MLILALGIVGITLWYSNRIASEIRLRERENVELWSRAVKKKAELVMFTEKLFDELSEEERKKADLLGKVYRYLSENDEITEFELATEILRTNATIPVMIADDTGNVLFSSNLDEARKSDMGYLDSLLNVMRLRHNPIRLVEVGQSIYYNDSRLFSQLQITMDDLINAFISETVINAASVPVIMTDSTRRNILTAALGADILPTDTTTLRERLNSMAIHNEPIRIELPGQGVRLIFFEDSVVLQRLSLFPLYQLILIAVFLIVSYLIFSTFRKAEQNQVWVGMAKETAHQLGTPLSSLMAWTTLIEEGKATSEMVVEMNKDIQRLVTVSERFSKIGSTPELKMYALDEVVKTSIEYLSSRSSKNILMTVEVAPGIYSAMINEALFGWVIENIVKNAIDAMEGYGKISVSVFDNGSSLCVELADTGKGIPKSDWNAVFQPGFTTKTRGWGLGLSLAKRIITEYHNGNIYISKSEKGRGSTFRIELNRAQSIEFS